MGADRHVLRVDWEPLPNRCDYFSRLGMPPGPLLGKDDVAVNFNLEATTMAACEGNRLEMIAVFFDNFARQPGGAQTIVSLVAIDDIHSHRRTSLI